MTLLAKTKDYLVESCASPGNGYMVTVARREDGHCVALHGRSIVANFKACVKSHGVDRAIESWIRANRNVWKPLYKANAMPRLLD